MKLPFFWQYGAFLGANQHFPEEKNSKNQANLLQPNGEAGVIVTI
jgi:hypothetical protein